MNAVIHKIGSDEIKYFVQDCVKEGNNFFGSNIKLIGIKPRHWSVVWTEDVVEPIGDGWNKKVSELNHSTETIELAKTDQIEYSKAVKIAKFLSSKTYAQAENYINNNVTDLATAKSYLIDLSKVVLALMKIVNAKD